MTRSFAAYAAARVAEAPATPWAPLVVVVADEAEARKLASDIGFFRGESRAVVRIAAVDTSPYAELSADRPALMARMTALYRLAAVADCSVVVASASSLLRRVIPRDELVALTDRIAKHTEIDRDDTAATLLRAGYTRVPVVEDPGTFAVRGGVIDVFPPLYKYPARIELFGDEVDSIRMFDPQSQRTLRELDELTVHPVRETIPTTGGDPRTRILEVADLAAHPSAATRRVLEQISQGNEFVGIDTLAPAFHARMDPVWSYLPPGAAHLIVDPDAIARAITDELDIAAARYRDRVDDHRLAFPPDDHYVSAEDIATALAAAAHRVEVRGIEMYSEDGGDAVQALRFSVDDNRGLRDALEHARRQHADELIRPLVDAIGRWRADGWRVGICVESATRTEQLAALLAEYGCPAARAQGERPRPEDIEPGGPPTLFRGSLSAGFALPADRIALVTDDEIFGERRRTSARQRDAAKRARAALLGGVGDFSQLGVGDYLVHTLHGVGLYKGLAKLPLKGTPIDFLHLEYVGGTLYLPVYRLNEVQRYVGAEGHKPRLDKLGGVTWDKARNQVSQHVRALAEELLQLYAQREALPGHAFPQPDAMFREFEATFEFEETPDQQRAIDQVMADMESTDPMDRLVCGDVGYGKTEVALRAILKAALGGKQAAMLAPTTVLVEQHFRTMTDRFSGWPINIAKLSRFQSRAKQVETIKGLADGSIDAVVATHRLLSKDVRFKDLGLLVVDEEQRFGVTHKERLKKLRTQVDVLTLTATPIPRTLHLAMTGLRDLSIIATPPADRRSIRTFISRDDDGVLREGIRRELARGGQIFFVAPRIGSGSKSRERSLGEWADHLARLVPEARVAVAHGQMNSDALERIMIAFVAGKHDILISTTIIENGLDIPRANTMFVTRADRFGLSQLYQLRGRIGRSKQRAFCYLLVPPPEKLTDDARRRLETLQRFTDLGAGFQIASHDLEIRGAGELLGAKQSGSIAAVGFDTYTSMLEEAVAELRGQAITHDADPELNVDVPGFIPDDYVPDTGQRLDLYKRLSGAADEDEVREMLDEINDRYGALPLEVVLLGDLMVLKTLVRPLRAQSLDLTSSQLTLALSMDTPLGPAKVVELVNKAGSRYRLTPDMRLAYTFAADPGGESPIARARECLLELLACAT